MEIGSTSCRDGNKGICSSLGHGHSKSKSLLHTDPVLIASRESNCSGMVDLDLTGLLLGMKARGKFVIDHIERLALSLIEGTTACGDRVYPVYGVNSILRSCFLLYMYVQEGRAESMGGASGRAGAPIIGGEPLLHLIGDFGDGGLRVSNAVGGSSTDEISSPTEWTGMCHYLTAAYIFLSNAYQWILIAVLSVWYVISPPQSFWNVGMWFQPSSLSSCSCQLCQRALITNSGSYSGQITAKLLQNV